MWQGKSEGRDDAANVVIAKRDTGNEILFIFYDEQIGNLFDILFDRAKDPESLITYTDAVELSRQAVAGVADE